eukprot:9486303-Pyramimonas_sp.AAC.1
MLRFFSRFEVRVSRSEDRESGIRGDVAMAASRNGSRGPVVRCVHADVLKYAHSYCRGTVNVYAM